MLAMKVESNKADLMSFHSVQSVNWKSESLKANEKIFVSHSSL